MDNEHAVKFGLGSGCGDTQSINGLDTILHLGNSFHDKLQVKDKIPETSSDSPSDEDVSSGLDDENTCNLDQNMDGSSAPASKCLHKSSTFPVSRKLISAIKGSREKELGSQNKLSVSWAPDVYDPPPTSVSHFPRKKNQQQYSKSHKKHGKGKHKGKNVPKEKKHYRKSGGRSNRGSDCYADTDRVHGYTSSLEMLDLNDPGIGSPDRNCGSKFLGHSSGTMHCVY